MNGLNGLNGLNGTAVLATGGLVGPGGVAGTGLLANTGDPNNRNPVISGVLVAAGNTVSGVAATGSPLAEKIDGALPGNLTIVGRVIETVDRTGQTLVRAGNGTDYLVDGLAAAPGQLVTLDLQNTRVLGRNGDHPLVGASLLSPGTQQGALLTVGVGSGGQPLTVGIGQQNVVGGLVSAATGAAGQTGGTGGTTNPVSGVVGAATGILGGVTGGQSGTTNPVTGLLGGVTGAVSGKSHSGGH